jgi:hypothetical protein
MRLRNDSTHPLRCDGVRPLGISMWNPENTKTFRTSRGLALRQSVSTDRTAFRTRLARSSGIISWCCIGEVRKEGSVSIPTTLCRCAMNQRVRRARASRRLLVHGCTWPGIAPFAVDGGRQGREKDMRNRNPSPLPTEMQTQTPVEGSTIHRPVFSVQLRPRRMAANDIRM